jgi:uroporphyrinogen-III synthase
VRLLVTRPEPENVRTAASLRARGHDVLLMPLLRIAAVDFRLPSEPYAALALTSAAAARALDGHPRRATLLPLPVFTVGTRTAAAARALGFAVVHSADGDQHDLVTLIRAHCDPAAGPVLHLAGEDRAGDLAGALAAAGIRVATVVAYRAVKAERFAPEVATALEQRRLGGVLHFSRRTAEAYLECAAGARLTAAALAPVHFCLSQQVAAPLVAAGAPAIRIAARPDEAAMLALMEARR